MAKKKTVRKARKPVEPLHSNQQEMSTMQVWLWLIGGLVLLAIVFAIIDLVIKRYTG